MKCLVATIVNNGTLQIHQWLQCRFNLWDPSNATTSTTETTFCYVTLFSFPWWTHLYVAPRIWLWWRSRWQITREPKSGRLHSLPNQSGLVCFPHCFCCNHYHSVSVPPTHCLLPWQPMWKNCHIKGFNLHGTSIERGQSQKHSQRVNMVQGGVLEYDTPCHHITWWLCQQKSVTHVVYLAHVQWRSIPHQFDFIHPITP